MVVLEGLPHECTVKSSWDNMILGSQQRSLQGASASYRHCWLYEGANLAFTATFLVIFLNYFPKSLGNPSLLTHFPGLWAFLKMAVSSKVLWVDCPCVSRSLCHTRTHMCTHTHTHTHGSGRGRLLSLVGAAAHVLQAATHGPVSVLGILWASWEKHYYYNLTLITGAVQVPSSGFSFFISKIIPMDGN